MKKPLLRLFALAPLATATLVLAQAGAPAGGSSNAETAAPPAVEKAPQATAPATAPEAVARPATAAAEAANQRVNAVFDRILEPLELTEEQKAKVAEIRVAWLDRTQELRGEARQAALALQALRGSTGAAPAEVEARRGELAAAQQKLRAAVSELDQQIGAVLDEERREKFLAIRRDMLGQGEEAAAPESRPAPKAGSNAPIGGR
jgi:Spy/CpxP family protein refolding chaperone